MPKTIFAVADEVIRLLASSDLGVESQKFVALAVYDGLEVHIEERNWAIKQEVGLGGTNLSRAREAIGAMESGILPKAEDADND